MIKLASEKCLNKFSYPVKSTKGKIISGSPVWFEWNGLGFSCEGGVFSEKERMIADIVCSEIIHRLYNTLPNQPTDYSKRIPTQRETMVKENSSKYITKKLLIQFLLDNQNNSTCIIPEGYYIEEKILSKEIDGINSRVKKPVTIILNDGHLRRQLPFMKKYTSVQISKMIKQTANVRLKMKFPVRFFENGKYHTFPFANIYCPSNLFTLVGIRPAKIAKNGNILERKYLIRLNTLIAHFFVQNVISCYVDLLPGHFYEMSGYTQLFYRTLILPYFKGAKIPISLEEIKARMCLKSDNYMARVTIKKWFEELEANRFISEPFEILNGGYWYEYQKNTWEAVNAIN